MVKEKCTNINPWLTIWLNPRRTYELVANNTSNYLIIILSLIVGIEELLYQLFNRKFGDTLPFLLLLELIFVAGLIEGLTRLFLTSVVLQWTGKIFGGKGTFKEIQTAYAWSHVPSILILIFWILILGIWRNAVFSNPTPHILSLAMLLFLIGLVSIWEVFIFIKCIGIRCKTGLYVGA